MQLFSLQDKEYPYLKSPDPNERTIELGWGYSFLQKYAGRKILEVGNTTHVLEEELPERDVVCKYDQEGGEEINRVDILDWERKPYALVLALSTFEHIGKDYGEDVSAYKATAAIEHCKSLLSLDGLLAFTIPVGWRRDLEKDLFNTIELSSINLMCRDKDNNWKEIPVEEVEKLEYPSPWGAAHGVLFCTYKPSKR